MKLIGTLTLFLLLPLALHAQPLNLDLMAGTLGGESICDLDVDTATDLLGRPSVVDDRIASLFIGLDFHDKGVEFTFYTWGGVSATFHMSEKWDADHSKHYQPFSGSISLGIDGNWKAKKIESEFSSDSVRVQTPEELKADLQKNGLYSPNITLVYTVIVELEDHSLSFQHEKVTKFLEILTVSCLD